LLLGRIGRCQAGLGQYSAAETTHRQALVLNEKNLGKEHDQTLISMNNVGVALKNQGKYKGAEAMHRNQGKYKGAEAMHRQTLAWREKVLGAEHPRTLTSMGDLAGVLDMQGKYEEAESMNRQTLARREKVLGAEHPHTLSNISNLALVLDMQGKYEEAESMNRQTLVRREKVLEVEHLYTLMSMSNLAER
jgi:tetratricopeptide (TPR) repeat protein